MASSRSFVRTKKISMTTTSAVRRTSSESRPPGKLVSKAIDPYMLPQSLSTVALFAMLLPCMACAALAILALLQLIITLLLCVKVDVYSLSIKTQSELEPSSCFTAPVFTIAVTKRLQEDVCMTAYGCRVVLEARWQGSWTTAEP